MPSFSSAALFSHRPFFLYFMTRGLSEFAYQIGAVAVGWQIYTLTGSALALGLVGLVQFFPTLVFTLIAGHVADRHERRRIVVACQLVRHTSTEPIHATAVRWRECSTTNVASTPV